MSQPTAPFTWDPALYDRQHAFVFQKASELLAMLNPQPGELILDVGCGTGQLTAAIASTGAEAVGVDASTDMLERARERFPDLHFLEADIRKLRLDRRFDAIFSNAALHWIPEAEAAVICLRRALREGGRVVAEFGGKGNVSAVLEAVGQAGDRLGYKLTNPWYFPSPAEYAALLERHLFEVRSIALIDRPTELADPEGGFRDWLRQFGQPFLAKIPRKVHDDFLSLAEEAARKDLFRDGGWWIDYRRLRVEAVKLRGAA